MPALVPSSAPNRTVPTLGSERLPTRRIRARASALLLTARRPLVRPHRGRFSAPPHRGPAAGGSEAGPPPRAGRSRRPPAPTRPPARGSPCLAATSAGGGREGPSCVLPGALALGSGLPEPSLDRAPGSTRETRRRGRGLCSAPARCWGRSRPPRDVREGESARALRGRGGERGGGDGRERRR